MQQSTTNWINVWTNLIRVGRACQPSKAKYKQTVSCLSQIFVHILKVKKKN